MMWTKIKYLWHRLITEDDGFIGMAMAGIGAGTSLYNMYKKSQMKDREMSPMLANAIKELQSNTGDNQFNRQRAEGSEVIARGKAETLEDARATFGRDPGRMQEVFGNIQQTVGQQVGALNAGVEDRRFQYQENRKDKLFDVSMALEEMEAAKHQAKKDSHDALIGAGIGMAGQGLSAMIQSQNMDKMIEAMQDPPVADVVANNTPSVFSSEFGATLEHTPLSAGLTTNSDVGMTPGSSSIPGTGTTGALWERLKRHVPGTKNLRASMLRDDADGARALLDVDRLPPVPTGTLEDIVSDVNKLKKTPIKGQATPSHSEKMFTQGALGTPNTDYNPNAPLLDVSQKPPKKMNTKSLQELRNMMLTKVGGKPGQAYNPKMAPLMKYLAENPDMQDNPEMMALMQGLMKMGNR